MAQIPRPKQFGRVRQESKPFPAKHIAAQLFKVFLWYLAYLYCAGQQICHTADGSETSAAVNSESVASTRNWEVTAMGAAAGNDGEQSRGAGGRSLCSYRQASTNKLTRGRAQTALLPRALGSPNAGHATAGVAFRNILKSRMLQPSRTSVAAEEGKDSASGTTTPSTFSHNHTPSNNVEHDAIVNNTNFIDYFLNELPCRDQVLLLATVLQNTPTALSTTNGSTPDEVLALQQLLPRTPAESLLMRPAYASRPLPAVADVTPASAMVRERLGEEPGTQSRPVGPAAARSTVATPFSGKLHVSPDPLPGFHSPESSHSSEFLSARAPSHLIAAPPLSSSLSVALPAARNADQTSDTSPLNPSFVFGSPATISGEAGSTSGRLPVYFSPTNPALRAGPSTLTGSPVRDFSAGAQQSFVLPVAPAANGASGAPGNTPAFDYSGRTVAPIYVSTHIRRSTAPPTYVPSALLASPFVSGALSPTIVGARVTNAVGTAVGQTTLLLDDTLRSAIVNVVNPVTHGATSLLQGVQAVNHKLQIGSDVATKALLDFAAYRRNHPQDSLAEFINTLEEVTDTLNQAATTTPDPRLQCKGATQAQLDLPHVAGGELLEGMGHNLNSHSGTRKSDPLLPQVSARSAWGYQHEKDLTAKSLGAVQATQQESSPPPSDENRGSVVPEESPLLSPMTGKTTQKINMRDVLTTEQLQVMEMLTGVLNMGFDAVLRFVRRQEYGIVGLKQFPFFQPLQHRVIQAAYRASERAAAERAALDSEFAPRGEPITVDRNYPRTRYTSATDVQPDSAIYRGNTVPHTKKDTLFLESAQRGAGANLILQIPTAGNGQSLPSSTADPKDHFHRVPHLMQKQQQGQLWQSSAPSASNFGVGGHALVDQALVPLSQSQPVALSGIRSVLPTYVPLIAPVLSTATVLTPRAEEQRLDTQPLFPPQIELAPHGAETPKLFFRQQQRRLRPTPDLNKSASPIFRRASAPSRRLQRESRKLEVSQNCIEDRVPTTDSAATTAIPSAPVGAIPPHPASTEDLHSPSVSPIGKRVTLSKAHGSVANIRGDKPEPRRLREDQIYRESSEDNDAGASGVLAHAPYGRMAYVAKFLKQDALRPAQHQPLGRRKLSTPFIKNAHDWARGVVGEAVELPTELPTTVGYLAYIWNGVSNTSKRAEGGRATHIESKQLQGARRFTVGEESPLPQVSAKSKALPQNMTAQYQSPLVEQTEQRTTSPATDCLPVYGPAASTSSSSFRQKKSRAAGKRVTQIRGLVERSLMALPEAGIGVAASAAASTLPAAAVGVSVFPTAVEQIFSRIGLQEKCVLSNVRYRGLASVVDRRSSLGSCQAACRADVAGAAVAARTQFPVPKTPPATGSASRGNITEGVLRLTAAPCRYTSYLREVGLCYRYATVEGLLPATGYTSAPITCSIIETAQVPAQELPRARVPPPLSHASLSPYDTAMPNPSQNLVLPTEGGQRKEHSRGAQVEPLHAQQQQWNMQQGLPQTQMAHQNGVLERAALARASSPALSSRGGKPYLVTEQQKGKDVIQPNSTGSKFFSPTPSTVPLRTDTVYEVPNAFVKKSHTHRTPTPAENAIEQHAAVHTVPPASQSTINSEIPPSWHVPFPADPPVPQGGSGTNLLSSTPGEGLIGPNLFLNSDPSGVQLTGQQVVFPAPNGASLPNAGFVNPGALGRHYSTIAVSNVPAIVPLSPAPPGPQGVGQGAPPVTISTAGIGAGVPLVPLPPPPPPMTALSALPPLPSITTPIAGTATSILQTAQGLMQTGNALMQAFPLQQLLDAGQQLYASGFFRNRGMKHLQLPFLGQQKQELPPPPGMEKPTVTCATEGMTCCVPENAAEKWKERPPYLNNHEWDRKCRAHFVSLTNSLCATTSYVLKGKGREKDNTEAHQTVAVSKLFPTPEDEVDHCGLVLTETREFWVFRHTLIIPGRSMNNAICECKEPKTPNQEGLRQIEGFATWEFSLQAVHDMEAQVERGEKIAKGLGTALALTTVLGRQGEEALGHMLEHTNTVTA